MFFSKWLKGSLRSPHTPRRRKQPRRFVPGLETLEDRAVPAIFTVNTLADTVDAGDGVTSLREAVLGANLLAGADDIQFQAGFRGATITLTSGQLSITDSVTITGPVLGITINGNNSSRIFSVNDVTTGLLEVEMVRLTLTGGNALVSGGAILNTENLTLTNCTLSDNTAGENGGGIYNEGTATLTNCTLSGNSANFADGSSNGGGIYSTGTATLSNCTLSGNSAIQGGGMFNGESATATLTDCTSSANVAVNGGGLANFGTATLTDCTLSNNSADIGGGLYNDGTATLTGCALSDNSAILDGGGIENFNGTVALTNCTLSDNSAGEDGGGIYNEATVTLTGCTLSGNSAVQGGGGINNQFGTATLTDCTLSGNSAGFGGGLRNTQGTATLTNCTLSNNSSGSTGGGLLNTLGTVTLTDSTLSGNTAGTVIAGSGGGLFNGGTATLSNCTLSGNSATDGSGDIFSNSEGGGIFNSGTATLTDCSLSNNGADNGGAINNFGTATLTNCALTDNSAFAGDGLLNDGTATLTNCTLSDNLGSGIGNDGSGVLTLADCTLSNNSGSGISNNGTATLTNCTLSLNSGSGIVNFGTATLTDCTLSDNSSPFGGGGVGNLGTVALTNCTLSNNSADNGFGGGILNFSDSTATLTDCTLSGNSASGDGGGIANSGTTTLTNCTLSDNEANDGGGLRNFGTATLTNCTLSDNIASEFGGGLFNNSGTATLTGCTLSGNSAGNSGGGLFNDIAGTATLTNCTLSDNSAGIAGGGILNSGGTVLLSTSTLSNNSAILGGGLSNVGTATMNNTVVANSASGEDIVNIGGTLTGSHNLIEDGSGGPGLTNTITGDPLLGPLADNGGPTLTHTLLAGSPAINAGDDTLVPAGVTTDQRGANRFVGTVDIGAFEAPAADNPNTRPVADAGGPYTVNEGSRVRLDASASTDAEQDPATLTYRWDFDGDGEFDDAVGVAPSFSAVGLDGLPLGTLVTVRVRVSDAEGLASIDTATVRVLNVAPTIRTFNVPPSGTQGTPIFFSATATDPAGSLDPLSFSWMITRPDGSTFTLSGAIAGFTPADFGNYVVRLTVTDGDGGSATRTARIDVNAPPIADAGGPYTVNEGSSIQLDASGSTDADNQATLTYEWDFDGDGQFEATGIAPTFSAAGLDGFAGATVTVGLRVTDADGLSSTDTATIAIDNLAPTVTLSGPAAGVRGQQLHFSGSFTDPGPDGHMTLWQVFDSSNNVVATGSGLTFDFTPAESGAFSVTFSVTDDDNDTGSASQPLTVFVVELLPDDCDPTRTMLVVGGTTGNDAILISPAGNGGSVDVTLNGVSQGVFTPTGRIVAYGQAGDDLIQATGGVSASAWLYGGAGNDVLKGGKGNDVLLGGAGNDDLQGGQGRDLLIGGIGADLLKGNNGDDLLIAAFTSFDDDTAALCAVLAEWTRTDRTYDERVASLRNGGGLNGSLVLVADGPGATVHDDGEADTLTGNNGLDWFFANLNGGVLDVITDLDEDEETDDV